MCKAWGWMGFPFLVRGGFSSSSRIEEISTIGQEKKLGTIYSKLPPSASLFVCSISEPMSVLKDKCPLNSTFQ